MEPQARTEVTKSVDGEVNNRSMCHGRRDAVVRVRRGGLLTGVATVIPFGRRASSPVSRRLAEEGRVRSDEQDTDNGRCSHSTILVLTRAAHLLCTSSRCWTRDQRDYSHCGGFGSRGPLERIFDVVRTRSTEDNLKYLIGFFPSQGRYGRSLQRNRLRTTNLARTILRYRRGDSPKHPPRNRRTRLQHRS